MKRLALVGFPPHIAQQDSGVFIRGEPPNKKTTRQQDKTLPLPESSWKQIPISRTAKISLVSIEFIAIGMTH
jgi:hypothetical protein